MFDQLTDAEFRALVRAVRREYDRALSRISEYEAVDLAAVSTLCGKVQSEEQHRFKEVDA